MKTIFGRLLVGAVLAAGLSACSGSSSKQSPVLEAQSFRLNTELGKLAQDSPEFLSDIAVNYAGDTLAVSVDFADPSLKASDFSEPLVQYVIAQYLKAHPGKNLDELLNTLGETKGTMAVTVADVDGASVKYNLNSAQLKNLFKRKPMELGYNEVRAKVVAIMESRCEALKNEYKAESVEFTIAGGFAQYTFTFARPTAFASLNQASLRGRYLKPLQAQYESYGVCRPMVEEFLKSLSIDGYRYVYTDKAGSKKISAAIPWNMI